MVIIVIGKKASAIVLITVLLVALIGVLFLFNSTTNEPTGAASIKIKKITEYVIVCHEGETKILPSQALNAHLGHGDTQGACTITTTTTTEEPTTTTTESPTTTTTVPSTTTTTEESTTTTTEPSTTTTTVPTTTTTVPSVTTTTTCPIAGGIGGGECGPA